MRKILAPNLRLSTLLPQFRQATADHLTD